MSGGGVSPPGDLADFCAVAIMAKAPRVGDVKTRLVPPLSDAQAAALSGCFIRDIAENIILAAQSAPIDGYIAFSPPGSEAEFRHLLPDATRLLPSRAARARLQPLRCGRGFAGCRLWLSLPGQLG